jgi:hypothetical protein
VLGCNRTFQVDLQDIELPEKKNQKFVNYEDIKTSKEQIKLIHDFKQVVLILMLTKHQTLAQK